MDSHKVTLAKTISWYVIHNIMMFLLGYLLTGDIMVGVAFAVLETIGEAILYYGHERFWVKIRKKKNATIRV